MAKRHEPKRKSSEDFLQDLRKGRQACFGHLEGRRYLEKVISAQDSLPNAVKFYAYDMLAEDAYQEGAMDKCLEAVKGAQEHMAAAQEEWPREFKEYLPQLRFCPTGGISPTNAPDYLGLSNVGCVGGSWITPPDALANHEFARVEALARAAVALR